MREWHELQARHSACEALCGSGRIGCNSAANAFTMFTNPVPCKGEQLQ